MFANKKDLEHANIQIDFLWKRVQDLERSRRMMESSVLPHATLETTHEKKLGKYENAYSIEKLYANAEINASDKSGLAEVKLVVCLNASDWYKFQSQSFFQELIQYLDNSGIQKTHYAPGQEQDLMGKRESLERQHL